jgi:NADPH:quinone reductase-like Zn-dependent oxidoreductase
MIGNDFAGVVEELGPDVPASEGVWTVGERLGERVAGVILGSQVPFHTCA